MLNRTHGPVKPSRNILHISPECSQTCVYEFSRSGLPTNTLDMFVTPTKTFYNVLLNMVCLDSNVDQPICFKAPSSGDARHAEASPSKT